MRPNSAWHTWIAVACLEALTVVSVRAQPSQTEKNAAMEVAKFENGLARLREHFKRGIASAAEVDVAVIDLHEARIRLAEIRADVNEVLPNLKEVVAAWERILARMLRQPPAQGETQTNVDTVTRGLAEARLRVAKLNDDKKEMLRQLEVIVAAAEREFNRTDAAVKKRIGTQQELDKVRKVLDDARRRRAELNDK